MTGIRITSKTSEGEKALRQHLAEVQKMGMREKLAAKGVLKHTVVNEEPLTIEIIITSNLFLKSLEVGGMSPKIVLRNIVTKALGENGAVASVDYTTEEVC